MSASFLSAMNTRAEDAVECDECTDDNRCEECTHCSRTRVCDMCECVGGCYDDCIYLVSDEEEEDDECLIAVYEATKDNRNSVGDDLEYLKFHCNNKKHVKRIFDEDYEGQFYYDLVKDDYFPVDYSDDEEDSDDEEPRTFGAYDILVVSPNDPHVNLHDLLSNNLSKVKEYCDTYGLDYKNIRAYEVDEDPNSDGEYEVTSYDNGIKYKKIKENDILLTEETAFESV